MKETILVASTTLVGRKLQQLTQREEITIIFCDSSREALEYLIDNTPDFIVLDQDLESVAGLEIIRKIRKVKRLYDVPVALLSFTAKIELTPPEQKLIDLHIEETITEAQLLEKIQAHSKEVQALKKTSTDLKSTMFLEQAISQLHTDEMPEAQTKLSKAQEMMLSPSERIQYLEAELERLKATLAEYQEHFGDIGHMSHESSDGNKPWLDVLLKPVF